MICDGYEKRSEYMAIKNRTVLDTLISTFSVAY